MKGSLLYTNESLILWPHNKIHVQGINDIISYNFYIIINPLQLHPSTFMYPGLLKTVLQYG